jgi:trk system potassium uptake protein TrkA
MKIVIVGGGKIGFYLIRTLIPFNHNITVIEKNEKYAKRIANELNLKVINDDGTNIDVLSEAISKKTDIFIAVTGRDQDNLIACQLAKNNFGVKRTISRINNPKNSIIFEKLSVDIVVSSTAIIAEMIEQEVDFTGMKTLLKLKNAKTVVNEIIIPSESPVCGNSLKDLDIPKGCIIMTILRGQEVIIPNGFSILQGGDCIITISSEDILEKLKDYFIGNK